MHLYLLKMAHLIAIYAWPYMVIIWGEEGSSFGGKVVKIAIFIATSALYMDIYLRK